MLYTHSLVTRILDRKLPECKDAKPGEEEKAAKWGEEGGQEEAMVVQVVVEGVVQEQEAGKEQEQEEEQKEEREEERSRSPELGSPSPPDDADDERGRGLSAYERARLKRIADNQRTLQQLGIAGLTQKAEALAAKKTQARGKRRCVPVLHLGRGRGRVVVVQCARCIPARTQTRAGRLAGAR